MVSYIHTNSASSASELLLCEHLTDAILTTAMQEDKHILGAYACRHICVHFNPSDATVVQLEERQREAAMVSMWLHRVNHYPDRVYLL